MAAKKEQATSKLMVTVMTGSSASGAPVYAQRTFAHINPALSDEDTLALGKKLGTLQSKEVAGILRQDAYGLVDGE